MTISELRNRLRYVKHGGVPLPLPRFSVRPGTRGGAASGGVRSDLRVTVRASPRGVPHPSSTPQPVGLPLDRAGTSAEQGTPPVSFGAPPDNQMSIAASESSLSLSGDNDQAALPPSGVVALSKPHPEMTAMLSRAAENVGLVWNPPPRPDPSRLDEWVLSAPLRCHSSRKCMRSSQVCGRHLLLPETNLVAPPPSPPSMVELLWGTRASPRWSGLWSHNCVQQPLPLCRVTRVSWACKYSSGLTGSAYRACGEAASALHAMALLQVYQAKALKDLHEGGHNLAVLHELRAATDLALRATKVTAQSLGHAMSTLWSRSVISGCVWLT